MRSIHIDWINHLLFNLFNQCKIRYTKRLQDVAKHFNSYEFRVNIVFPDLSLLETKKAAVKVTENKKQSRNILWIICAITINFYFFTRPVNSYALGVRLALWFLKLNKDTLQRQTVGRQESEWVTMVTGSLSNIFLPFLVTGYEVSMPMKKLECNWEDFLMSWFCLVSSGLWSPEVGKYCTTKCLSMTMIIDLICLQWPKSLLWVTLQSLYQVSLQTKQESWQSCLRNTF